MLQNANGRWLMPVFFVLVAFVAAGCGGGGATIVVQQAPTPGGGSSPSLPGTVSGSGFKGPFRAGALVQAFRVTSGQKGTLLATGTTDVSGNFSLRVADATYAGPVVLEMTGTYYDEATGADVSTGGNPLRGAVPSLPAGGSFSGVRITPLTHLAVALATARGALSEAGLTQAFNDVGTRFGVTSPQSTQPFDTTGNATGADTNSVRYGLVAAGFSQEAATLGVSTNTLISAASLDASDGSLDGFAGGSPIPMQTTSGGIVIYDNTAISSRLSTAIGTFVDGTRDGTGLSTTTTLVTDLQTVVNRVNRAPTASIAVNPQSATVGATIALDGRLSSDPDGDPITYTWNVSIGGIPIPVAGSTSPQAAFTPGVGGSYVVALTVRDSAGLTGIATTSVTIIQPPPPPPAAINIGNMAATVSAQPGQTGVVSIPIGNSGGQTANVSAVTLTFTGTAQFTVTARTGNPSTIAAGTTATYVFDVVVPNPATEGTFNVNVQVAATDGSSGQVVSASRLAVGGFAVLAQGSVPAVQLGTLTSSPSLTQGQSTILALPVTNPGTQTVDVLAASITFDDANIQSSLLPDSPSRISPGTTANLRFNTVVGASTLAGVRTASASVQARTVGTMLGADGSRNSVGSLTVIDIARLQVSNLVLSRTVVSRGAQVTASFRLSSIGGSAATITGLALDVGGTLISPTSPAVPSSMAVGTAITFSFTIDSTSLPLGPLTVAAAVSAIDSTSGNQPAPVIGVSSPPVLTVQSPAEISIVAVEPPSSAAIVLSQGQSQTVTLTVQNAGTADSNPTTATLTFFSGATDVSSQFVVAPSASNASVLAGGTLGAYRFIVTPRVGGVTGAVTVRATLSGTDVNSGFTLSPSTVNSTWTVQTPGRIALGTLTTQTRATQGQSFTLSQAIQNTGGAGLGNVRVSLVASGSGLTVTTVAAPTSIAGAGQATYQFRIDVAAGASPGARSLDFDISGTDANSGAAVTATARPLSTVTIETAASLTAGTMLAVDTASLGQTFFATIGVTNAGQAAATITSSTLLFSGLGLTVTPISGPTTIAGLSTGQFVYRVSVALGSALGARTASFSLTGLDANSGGGLFINNAAVGSVNVVSPGVLAIADITEPATVSQGQSFVVTVDVQNTGQNSIVMTTGTLTLSGNGMTIVPQANPTTIAGGQIVSFLFDVTAATTATAGARTAGVALTAVEAGTLANLSTSRPNAGTITVQTPAALSLAAIGGQTTGSQGQTIRVTYSATNGGQATAQITDSTLTFDNTLGLTISRVSAPTAIAGGATGQFVFDVVIAAGATPGNRTASIAVTAQDANSLNAANASNGSAGTINIQTPAGITVGSLVAPAAVSQGQTFLATVPLNNTGQAAATIPTATLQFSGTGLTVTPVSVPTAIAGLGTAAATFRVQVSGSATLGTRAASFTMVAFDANSGAALGVTNSTVGSVTVQTPGQIAIAGITGPSTVSRGQSFAVTVAVQNSGQGLVDTAAVALDISGDGMTIVGRVTNPAAISGGQTASFVFDVSVAVASTIGARSASITATAREAGLLQNLIATQPNAGTITVQTPAQLSISALGGQLTASQGQTALLTAVLTNSGGATARIAAGTLGFANASGLTISPVSIPTVLVGGSSATLQFNVGVASNAVPGNRSATLAITAQDANSGADISIPAQAAGTLVVQIPAALSLGTLQAPATASLGQTFLATIPVTNTGQAAINVSASFLQFSGAGLTVTPVSTPLTIAGFSTADYTYSVNVALGSALTARSAFFSIFGFDANSGNSLSLSQQNVGTVTVQSPGVLAVGGLTIPATVSRNGTFTVQIGVQNTGQNSVSGLTGTLTLSPDGLTVTPRGTNPTTVSGGQIVNFIYDVAVSGAAALGARTVDFSVSGTESGTLATVNASLTPQGGFSVQTEALLSAGSLSGQLTGNQGQTIQVSAVVTNSGQAPATLQGATLTFSNMTGLTVTVNTLPSSVTGTGGTATIVFDVAIGASAVPGVRTATLSVTAADSNSGLDKSIAPQAAGQIQIQTPAALSVGSLVAPSLVSIGQTFLATVPISNTGQASATITTAFLVMSGNNITVTPINTVTSVAGLGSVNVRVQVAVGLGATVGTRTGSFSVFGFDDNSGNAISISAQTVGSVSVVTQGALAISGVTIPAALSKGQSSTIQALVQNTGGNSVTGIVESLTLSSGGLTATPRGTNPTSLAGGASGTFIFDVTVDTTATSGSRTVDLDFTGTEAGTGGGVGASLPSAGTIAIQTPADFASISQTTAQADATQGQSFTATVDVRNTGEATANVSAITLAYGGSGLTVTPSPANPTTISGGVTATFSFTVAVSGAASPGAHAASVSISGTDANSASPISGTLATAGSVNVQTAATFSVGSLVAPSTVSLGQTFTATVPVTNTGQATANVSSAFLQFTGSGLTVTPISAPTTIPGLSTANYTYSVSVQLGSAQTARSALFSIFGSDANSGTALSVNGLGVGTVTVASPGVLAVGSLSVPGTVSQGQTFTLQIGVQNTGQNSVTALADTLTLGGGGLSFTAQAGNPTSVGGGAIVNFLYDVTVDSTATSGARSIAFTIGGTESGTGQALSASLSPNGSTTVQTPPSLSIGALTGQLTASQGQTIQLNCVVTNSGQATASLQAATLSFDNNTNLTISTVTLPATVAGSNGTATLVFNVTVGSSAVPGTRNGTVTLTAADANSGTDVSPSAAAVGSIGIETPAALSVSSLVSPSTVSIGQTFFATVPVSNTGQAAATITTAFLVFSGNNMTVTPVSIPSTINGLSSSNLRFQVAVGSGATAGSRAGSFSIFGFDENSGNSITISGASVGSVSVVAPGALAVTGMTIPASGSKGQTETIVASLQNTGGNSVTGISPTLTVSGGGATIVASGGNPTSLAAGAVGSFTYDVTFDTTATSGARTVGFTATGTEAGTLATVTASPTGSGTITVQSPSNPNTISTITSQSTVTQGQTFTASLTVQNTGEATANLSSVTLSFAGGTFTVTPDPGNPTTLAGGATGTFNYTVVVGGSVTSGAHQASVSVTATDANSGVSTPGSLANAGSVTVQTAPALAVTAFGGATKGNRSQSGLVVTYTITNTGQAQASITGGTLTMASGVTASLLTPLPILIGGSGGTGQLQFSVSIGSGATLGTGSMTAGATAVDSNSGLSASVASGVGSFQVQSRVNLTTGDVSILTAPSGLDRNGSAVTVTVRVTNGASADVATARISSSTVLTFGAFSAQFGVSNPSDLLTRDIVGGTFEDFDFQVTALSTATKAQAITINAGVTVTDQNDSTTDSDSGTTTWVVRDSADSVQGQADFASGAANRGGSAAANTLNLPSAVATDGTNVAVADTSNNRVLIFTSLTGSTATKVVGQANFTATGAGTSAAQLSAPQGVFFDSANRLVVVDTGNHRVLVFSDVATLPANNGAAIRVFGQADAVSGSADRGGAAAANTLDSPTDAVVGNDTLFIADTANNRVLMFTGYNAIVTAGTDGPAATRVVGQSDGTSTSANQGGTAAANTLSGPASVSTTGTRLAIADAGNNRVLVFTDFTAFAGDGPSANGVLGQSGTTGASANRGNASPAQNTLSSPMGVRFGFGSLFISDTVNHRVVTYSATATTGDSATDLLGQALYTTATSNNTVAATAPDAFSMSMPMRMATIGSSRVFVADQLNHRALRFTLP
ncbi:MAG: hypothetical protein HY816_17995 [Candidatus Wallbacteria bacterium]|nr:hypothetical protein [Candidatus Wallbacteria bacterium]